MTLIVILGDTRRTLEWHPDWRDIQKGELFTLDDLSGFVQSIHTIKRENYVPVVEVVLRAVGEYSTMPEGGR